MKAHYEAATLAERPMCADHPSTDRIIPRRLRIASTAMATLPRLLLLAALTTTTPLFPAPGIGAQAVHAATADTATVSPQLIDAGRKLYRGRAGCVVCHGSHMEGTPVAPAHKRSSGWKYARDGTIDELTRVIVDGIPGTVMVARPNGISAADAFVLATYIWSVNHLDVKP